MTIAQQLEQKGIKKGIEQGRSEGEREAAFKIARNMLERGLDEIAVMEMTGLSKDDMQSLLH